MTIYTFSSDLWHVDALQFSLLPLSATSPQSAFNPLAFTDGPTSEFWQVMATLAPAGADDRRDIDALLRKVRGRRHKLRIYDPSRTFRGAGGASPTLNVLDSAEAGAMTISVYGLVASQARAFAADDVIGIGENLYAVSDASPSNADGESTISILPPLRQGVAYGDPVNTYYPTGLFQLVEGGNSATVIPGDIRQPLTLQFMESPDFD
jgi:hypothetical protein